MEDYTVGSLADLISGTKTPNKRKVVTKTISPKVSESLKRNNEENIDETVSENVPKKKKKVVEDVSRDESKVESKKLTKKLKTKKNAAGKKPGKNDINAERRVKNKEKLEQKQEDTPEQKSRTVFVGNLPVTTRKDKLKKYFLKYGTVETVRFRGVPVANPKTPKKVALIKKEFHPERNTFYAFVRFTKPEEAEKATEANGLLYKEHHIRVSRVAGEEKNDESKAIFVGNLNFNTEDEELWSAFESCGPIASVRIIRDTRTGMGKGFGYVNFKESDAVTLALEMENVQIKGREVRIGLCNVGAAKKNKKTNKPKKISKPGSPKKAKKQPKNNDEKAETNGEAKPQKQSFEGSKFTEKKKANKFNKGLAQKKKMIKKIAPK